MQIIRYEPGAEAPKDVDCVKLECRPDGTWGLTGSALVDDKSVAMFEAVTYSSYADAEAAGMAWAAELGVDELHLEVMPAAVERWPSSS